MAIRNYLIEGVSGTGKSSVCRELVERGYHAINGDKELAYNGDPETGLSTLERGHHTWIWDEKKVRALAADKTEDKLFFCGGSRNFRKFLDCFDTVFILNANDKTIEHRLRTRSEGQWGKTKEQLAMVLHLNKTKEDIPSDGVIIDATQPLAVVTDRIIQYTQQES